MIASLSETSRQKGFDHRFGFGTDVFSTEFETKFDIDPPNYTNELQIARHEGTTDVVRQIIEDRKSNDKD